MDLKQDVMIRASEEESAFVERWAALPEEMHTEIVSIPNIDLPSRVAWSMVSKKFRRHLWTFNFGEYNNVRFLMECVRCDYFELLKFAYANGALLYDELFQTAMENSWSEPAAFWLYAAVAKPLPWKIYFRSIKIAAYLGYEELLESMLSEEKSVAGSVASALEDCIQYAARGGHGALVNKLRAKNILYGMKKSCPLIVQAAMGNQVDLALSLCADPSTPKPRELRWIMEGGLLGGQLEAVRFATSKGMNLTGEKNDSFVVLSAPVLRNTELLDYLLTNFPQYIRSLFGSMTSVLLRAPTIGSLKWLKDHGHKFEKEDVEKILSLGKPQGLERFPGSIVVESTQSELFECAQFLIEEVSADLDDKKLMDFRFESMKWATVSQIMWLRAKCQTLDWPSGFTEHVMDRSYMDSESLRFIIDLNPWNEPMINTICALDNNLESLDALHKALGLKLRERLNGSQLYFRHDPIERVIRSFLENDVKKGRARFANFIALMQWFFDHGFPLFSGAEASLRTIEKETMPSHLKGDLHQLIIKEATCTQFHRYY